MPESLEERLNRSAGGGSRPSEYEGQVLNWVSIETEPSPFRKGEVSVKALAVTPEGNEVEMYVTPTMGRQLQELEEDLPLELGVLGFPGQFGNKGYKLVMPQALEAE
jgi:hypothetical protein